MYDEAELLTSAHLITAGSRGVEQKAWGQDISLKGISPVTSFK
jgi:hypothetical protein